MEVELPEGVTVGLQQLRPQNFVVLQEMEAVVGAEEAVVGVGSQVDCDGGDDAHGVHCSEEC